MNLNSNASTHFLAIAVLVIGCICFFTGARQDGPPTPKIENDDRIDRLEKRVAILEKILFSSVKLETKRAERLLADRKARLKNSRKLFARGLITEFQLQQDRMQVEEAERELALATAQSNQKRLASELEVLDAEQRLKVAIKELEFSQNLARRGFATKTEVERLERLVDEATQNLEHVKIKLDAANEFESMKK